MSLVDLENHCSELATAIQSLAAYCRAQRSADSNLRSPLANGERTPELQPILPPDAPSEVHRTQLLACVRWLGEFQVLAFIPPQGCVPIGSLVDLTGVPEAQLARIVRMVATAGFLHQPQPNHVAHTALSVAFAERPCLLDAALFLSETIAPCSLQMATATQNFGVSRLSHETAYNIAFNTSSSFAENLEQRPRLQRQWPAFVRYGMGDLDASVYEVLLQYDWGGLPNDSLVVEVGASSTAIAAKLLRINPSLRLVIQVVERGVSDRVNVAPLLDLSRTLIQQYRPGTIQAITDAAVYIIHLPIISPLTSSELVHARITAELRAHMAVLSANRRSVLLLVPGPLLRSDASGQDVVSQLRDLCHWQLANEREMDTAELLSLVTGVSDSIGHLVVVGQLSSSHTTTALIVRYQTYYT
ncbi:hypothetical protein S40293_07808 [Stachybotrys chartarum IBT 40293]|nr:hypothetical protein S40293_07808 [Stachybotrys chartarum IBT 40293]